MIANAVDRPQFTVETGSQLLSLVNGIINRRFTCFVFVNSRLRNTQ